MQHNALIACRPAPRGFTLIELMVVVAVLAILATSAAPSFQAFLASLQVKAVSYDLTSDLMMARSEALKRNAGVRVAPLGTGWVSGWKVELAADSTRISSRTAPAASTTFTAAPDAIEFDGSGRVSSPTSAVRMTVGSSAASDATSRCVQLDLSGRARSDKGACP